MKSKKLVSAITALTLIASTFFCVSLPVQAAGYTRTLTDSLQVEGYKAKAFYNFQNNTPEVLPTSGDLCYRSGNIWGLHNYGSGSRSATATIPVTAGDILVLQHYSSDVVATISGGVLNSTLTASSGYQVYDITTTADDIRFTIARNGGIVAAFVMEPMQKRTLCEYGTSNVAWTTENLAEWTAGGNPTLADGVVTISGGNGSYSTSKTVAPTENAIINVEAVWKGASSTGRTFAQGNGSYFRFGNIIVAQNDQDQKHGYGFTGLGNIQSVTTFSAGSYRVDFTSSTWLKIGMVIDTQKNILRGFTIESEDGNTKYVEQSNVELTNPDYKTLAFGYKRTGSVGTTNVEQLKSLVISECAPPSVNLAKNSVLMPVSTVETVSLSDVIGDITVASDDTSVATATYDSATNSISIAGLSAGTANITVTAKNVSFTPTTETIAVTVKNPVGEHSETVSPTAKNRITNNNDGTFTTADNAGNQYALAIADLSALTNIDKATSVTVEFDTNIPSGSRCLIGLGDKTVRGTNANESNKSTYQTDGLIMRFGTSDGTYYRMNGGTNNSNAFDVNVHAKVTLDRVNGKYSYTLTSDDQELFSSSNISTSVDNLTIIEAYTWLSKAKFTFSDVLVSYTTKEMIVSVTEPTNGTVSVDSKEQYVTDTVNVTVSPSSGYAVDTVTVTTSSGGAVDVTNNNNGTYSFRMPDDNVTVSATFKATPTIILTEKSAFATETGATGTVRFSTTVDNKLNWDDSNSTLTGIGYAIVNVNDWSTISTKMSEFNGKDYIDKSGSTSIELGSDKPFFYEIHGISPDVHGVKFYAVPYLIYNINSASTTFWGAPITHASEFDWTKTNQAQIDSTVGHTAVGSN